MKGSRWLEDAACAGLDATTIDRVFFGDHHGLTRAQQDQAVAQRNQICGDCPVRVQCKEFGNGSLGAWGGGRVRTTKRNDKAKSAA